MADHDTVIRQTYKAKELPPRLREALNAADDSDVVIEATLQPAALPRRGRLSDLIGTGTGGFKSREEADAFIAGLRDEWPD